MKYCPVCDSEYVDASNHCADCGVDLIPAELRAAPLTEKERKDRIEVLWRGGDPSALSAVISILREAGIRHHVQPTNDHMVFEFAMPRPKYAVRVFSNDKQRAAELISDIHETLPFGLEDKSEALPEDTAPLPVSTPTPWNAAQATLEIWSGEDVSRADLLEACLAENQIGVTRKEPRPGTFALFIMPPDEPLAREILHEITEAIPPA